MCLLENIFHGFWLKVICDIIATNHYKLFDCFFLGKYNILKNFCKILQASMKNMTESPRKFN